MEILKRILQYDLENFPIRYMTSLLLIIIWIIWILLILNIVNINYSLTSTWAIIAFWYWYKKYERDKNIQHLENILNRLYDLTIIEKYNKLELFYIYQDKWLLENNIWNYINNNFWSNIEKDIEWYVIKQLDIILEKEKELELVLSLQSKYLKSQRENWIKKERIEEIEDNLDKYEAEKEILEKRKKEIKESLIKELIDIFIWLLNTNNDKYSNYLSEKFLSVNISETNSISSKIIKSIQEHLKSSEKTSKLQKKL